MEEADRTAERIARDSYGRILACLVARTRDVASAEDALGGAFASALKSWRVDGVPDNPDAWLLTAARRQHIDEARRRETGKAGAEHLNLVAEEIETMANNDKEIPDRRLALMFACSHPAIEEGMRTPLMLQTILGLTAQDIASAFLVAPATMGQRLTRAKARVRDAGIPFRVPDAGELAERESSVLDAIYATYNKGWSEVGEDALPELADESMWLGQLVVSLLPEQPEPKGMLALMLYTAARRSARRSPNGAFVPFEHQNVSLWDSSAIARAEQLLAQANAGGPSGRYQIEAGIQSAHVTRRLTGISNWPAVVALYDHLVAFTGSPVVVLNRAVARAEVNGPEAALSDLAPLERDKRMVSYQPYWAAKGYLSQLAGDTAAAAEALTIAIGLTTDDAVKHYLMERLAALPSGAT